MSALPAALAELRAYQSKIGAIVTAIEELILPTPVPPPPVEVAAAPKALTAGPRPRSKATATTPTKAPPTCVTCGVALVYRTGRRPTRCTAHGGKAKPLAGTAAAPAKAERKPGPCFNCNMSRRSSPCEHCGAR